MKRFLTHDILKILACVTMLIDHLGAVLLFIPEMRIIGRLSFPIFCFLLSEGVFHTRNPRKYALRIALLALVAELPFDYCFFGGIDWSHQNVMFTLLLGFVALQVGRDMDRIWKRFLVTLPFVVLGALLNMDYGADGVLLVVMFGLTREIRWRPLVQLVLMCLMFYSNSGWIVFYLLGIPVNIQLLCVLSMVPIALYNGEKQLNSRWIQWGFYLFYPVHMAILTFLQ